MAKPKLCGLFAAVLCCSAANAVEWEVEPSITIAATYTDNLRLAPDQPELGPDNQPLNPDDVIEDELVTEILPAIKIGATGKRLTVDLEYRLQALLYDRRDEFDETLNYSRVNGKAELVSDSVYVDFAGSLNQQIINPEGRIGLSGITQGAANNRAEVANFSIQPYWRKKLGKAANVHVGYQYGIVEYDTDPLATTARNLVDSKSNGVLASISGAPLAAPWSWRLDGKATRIEYDLAGSNRVEKVDLQRIGAELAWSFNADTSLFVGGGDEDNEFSSNRPTIGGSFWHLGLRGRLDSRTTYSMSAGEQHFGNSYQFSLKRQAGQLSADISYLEETTTVGQQQQGYEALFEFLSNIAGVELPASGVEVYVRKRLSATTELKYPRSRWRLTAFNEERDYLTTVLGGSDSVSSVALVWSWTVLPRTELSIEAGWQGFELRNSAENPENGRLQLRLRRDMKRGFFFNLGAWHNSRFATLPSKEYSESAVSIGLGKRF